MLFLEEIFKINEYERRKIKGWKIIVDKYKLEGERE